MQIGKWDPVAGKSRALFWAVSFIVVVVAISAWYRAAHEPAGGSLFGGLGLTDETASTTPAAASSTSPGKQKVAAKKPAALASVTTTAERLPGASQFISLFKSTDVAAAVTGKGPYTIFVPTNGAFSQLPAGTIPKMTPAQKLRFVQYHVVVGRAIDPEAQVAGTIQALSGDMLNFSFGADKIPLVGSAIFIKKYQASNGVVYLIDNVLLPPQR